VDLVDDGGVRVRAFCLRPDGTDDHPEAPAQARGHPGGDPAGMGVKHKNTLQNNQNTKTHYKTTKTKKGGNHLFFVQNGFGVSLSF